MLLSDDDLSDKKEPRYCWKSVLGVEKKCNGFQARIQWTSKKDGINHNESMEALSRWTNHDNRLTELTKWAAQGTQICDKFLVGTKMEKNQSNDAVNGVVKSS